MECENCNKRSATVHLINLSGGEKKEIHLCEKCAQEKQLGLPPSVTIPELLSSIIEFYSDKQPTGLEDARCPRCGLTYDDFKSSGRLGCPNDYEVFEAALTPLLEKIHQGSQHTGKVPAAEPSGASRTVRLAQLRRELDQAVKNEQYERAAQLRDQINGLKGED